MFCQECGTELPNEAVRCSNCGHWTKGPVRQNLEDDEGIRMLIPVGRTPLSIAAGYLGLLAIMPVFAPIALVVSIIAIVGLVKHPEKRGMGRAVFGVIMGGLFTIVLLFVVFCVMTGG